MRHKRGKAAVQIWGRALAVDADNLATILVNRTNTFLQSQVDIADA